MPSVFLSHSHGDKPFVRGLAARLTQAGAVVWLDEAALNIGDSLIERISSAIEEMEFVAAILSPRSVKSNWVQKELSLAMTKEVKGRRVTVLPILIEPCDLPQALRDKLYADFTRPENHEREFAKILRAIGLAPAPIEVPTAPIGEPPIDQARDGSGFIDLRIVGVDKNRTHNPDESMALYDVYLQLSADPPEHWDDLFGEQRRFPRHSMWRRAWVEDGFIVVHCPLEELQRYHLADLKEDVAETNKKYRALLEQSRRQHTRAQQRADEERRRKGQALDSLDFSP